MVKIQSITDVITNSSTEVFTYYDDNLVEQTKDMINSILELTNTELKCEDLFDIRMIPSDYVRDCLWDLIYDDKIDPEKYNINKEEFDISDEDLIRCMNDNPDLFNLDDGYVDRPKWEGIVIEAKAEKYKPLAMKISYLVNDNCDHEAYYNG